MKMRKNTSAISGRISRKTFNLLMALMLIWIGFSTCTNEETPVNPQTPKDVLSIGVNKIQTKALDDAFEIADKIGLYAVKWVDSSTQGKLVSTGNYADNVMFTLQDDNDNWSGNNTIYYPDDKSKLDLYAYYPYKENVLKEGSSVIIFKVASDQSDYANYTGSDLIVSSQESVVNSSQKVTLTFDHMLSQLVFALKAGEGFTTEEIKNSRITIKNAIIDGELDLSEGNNGIPSAGQTKADVLPTGEWKQSQDDLNGLYGYKAIIVPQDLNQNTYLEIKLGERTFYQKFVTPIQMKSGESRSFIITLNNNEADLSTSMNPWNSADPFESTAEEKEEDPDTFIFELEAKGNTSVNIEINLPEEGIIDWGNGSIEPVTNTQTYTYTTDGSYKVKVKGLIDKINFKNSSVTKVIQWGNIQMDNWNAVFESCSKLKSIPTGIPSGNSFNSTFIDCTELTTIPEGLFENNTEVTFFSSTFWGCISITSIPEDLFEHNVKVKSFGSVFRNCTGLTSIPENLFANNVLVEGFSETFRGCTSLVSIPENLFANLIRMDDIIDVFYGCTSLTAIPEKLFEKNINLRRLSHVFYGCTSLTSFPENLFANNPEIIYFYFTFKNCTGLTSIPENLFANNTKVTDFCQAFSGCTSLKNIPSKLFANNTKVTRFSNIFFECISLTSIPIDLFDNNMDVTDFSAAFKGCMNLTGTTPKTNGIELWRRSFYPEFPDDISILSCFGGCTGLDNYDQIPVTVTMDY